MSTQTAIDAAIAEARDWYHANWSPDLNLAEWWDRLGRSGWAFPAWPSRWFGRGLASDAARAVVADRMALRVFGPVSGVATFLAAPTIFACGTDEQRDRFLPGIATGQDVWCQLFSEPSAGSDMASLQTRAVRDGDEWVVTGQKVWNSGAQHARYGILIARTDPDVPKHKGITYFLIDMKQPGVDVRPLREMTGEAAFNEVFLTEARVPDANRLGALGEGWRVAMTTLSNERDPNNAGMGGGGGNGFGHVDLSLTVAQYREQQSKEVDAFSFALGGGVVPLVDQLATEFERRCDPLVRQRLARLTSARKTQSWTGQRGKANAKGGQPGPEVSTLKLAGSATGRRIRDLGLSMMGAHGMLADGDAPTGGLFHKYSMFVQAMSIAGGSDEVQRNIVGERVLGLPKEPDEGRDLPFRQVRVSR